MPRLKPNAVPSYRLHKQSGQGVVTLNGRDILLGKFNAATSLQEYNRVLAEWLAAGRTTHAAIADVTVAELVAKFWIHGEATYQEASDGKSELENFRMALTPLLALYSNQPASSFSPLGLKAVRENMIGRGWCRSVVNRQVARIKQVFKWAVENEIVPPVVHHGLSAVAGIRQGSATVREAEPVAPVPDDLLNTTLPHLSPTIRAMVDLQLITGMRPGEVCQMRTCDIDRSATLWIYKPATHKNKHRGHARIVYLGARAQKVLNPFLKLNLQACLFSPVDSEADRHRLAAQRAGRPSPSKAGKPKGKRAPTDRYDVHAYRRAIARACDKAFELPENLIEPITPKQKSDATAAGRMNAEAIEARRLKRIAWRTDHTWHPHQLRHNAATRLRREYGLEAAQVILGHKTLSVTQVYAEKNVAAAQKIMAEVG